MRSILVVSLIVSALLLSSCGGGKAPAQTTSIINPPPVQAATGFTNANLSGTYAFGVAGTTTSGAEAGTGVAALDGNGNITSGEETVNLGGLSCHGTFTGTYSVNANGTGTGAITSVVDAASAARGCVGGSGTLSLALSAGGNNLILASQSATAVTVATAVKQ